MPVIIIHAYDTQWVIIFESLRRQFITTLGALIERVEHVGSTSVPGLAAKPSINVDLIISSKSKLDNIVPGLALLGYRHEGDLGIPGREAFATPIAAPAHHLYVYVRNNPELLQHIAFRDYLRTHSETMRDYGELKKALAVKHGSDRAAYTEAKIEFISSVLTQASMN